MTRATLFSLLVLVGCGAPQPTMIEPPVEAVEEPQVARAGVDGPWILERGSLDGASIPLPAGTRTMIDIDGEQLGLSAACNTYGAEIREAPFGLEVAVGAGTAMGCEDERGASESAVVEAVDRVTVIARDGGALVMTGEGVHLRFAALPIVDVRPFVDRVWILEQVVTLQGVTSAVGDPATFTVASDGTFRGSTGCRTFTGQWGTYGDLVTVLGIDMGFAECPAHLHQQDNAVVGVIGDRFIPSVEGPALTVRNPNGGELRYRLGDGS